MSKWPQLVLPQFCKTDLQVHIESEEIGEDGAPLYFGKDPCGGHWYVSDTRRYCARSGRDICRKGHHPGDRSRYRSRYKGAESGWQRQLYATGAEMKLTFYEGPMNMLEDAAMNALDATAEKLLGDVVDAQVIPFDVGTLQNEATYVDRSERSKGIERIVSNTPYARRLYFHPEYNFQTDNNPNARGKWLDDWVSGRYADQVKKDYAAFYKKYGGL